MGCGTSFGLGQTGGMERTIAAELAAPASRVRAVLEDLVTYPEWLDVVRRVEPAEAASDDAGPAWWVTLRARVGPLARSKRLRMVRTVHAPGRLRFERAEVDGRDHAAWTLDASIEGDDPCSVVVELRYDGGLWSSALDAVLGSQADTGVPRLAELVAR